MNSCWVFSPFATVEAGYCLTTGKTVKFSEQKIIDYYFSKGSWSVKRYMKKDGYNSHLVFVYLLKMGRISIASDYKYLENYRHRQLNLKKMELVDPLVHGFIHIPNDEYAIQLVVATQPVLAEILVYETFEKFNAKSVFKGKCRGQTFYHAVCITGYGVSEDSQEH